MRERERNRLVFTPQWEGQIKRYATGYIREHMWRCRQYGSDEGEKFQDLLQEAWIIFDRISYTYPRVVDPPHFLALFKTALRNYFHDHSRYTQKHIDETPCDVSVICADHVGEVTNEGYLRSLLANAPQELIFAFKALTAQDGRRRWEKGVKQRENLNMRLRRLTGFDRMKLNEHRNYNFKGAIDELFA